MDWQRWLIFGLAWAVAVPLAYVASRARWGWLGRILWWAAAGLAIMVACLVTLVAFLSM